MHHQYRANPLGLAAAACLLCVGLAAACGGDTTGGGGQNNIAVQADTGVGADTGVDTGDDVGVHQDTGTGEVCASGEHWRFGDAESPLMHPGDNCIDCHTSRREGPSFAVAGTVMGDLKDNVDCFGAAGATVELTGDNGEVLRMQTNQAGNFYSESAAALTVPYTAKVIYQGRERQMVTPQSDFNCANCHTASGANNAPGRILVP